VPFPFTIFIGESLQRARYSLENLRRHRYVDVLSRVSWSDYQVKPILLASVLINLLELASPIYINIVYTSVLPSGSMSSLVVLSVGVVFLMLLCGWLKSVRLALTGGDGARIEHRQRLDGYSHFLQLGLPDFLALSPGRHLQRLSSINVLRDESALQSLVTAIDLSFSVLFVAFLFLIAGSVGFIAVIAIVAYVYRSLAFANEFERLSRRLDLIELDTRTYQERLVNAADLINTNGLGGQFLVINERLQEEQARERMTHNILSARYQTFSASIAQCTFAVAVTWGAVLVVHNWLHVGALAAALLLLGKTLSPWQQAMGFWNSYRRFSHSRDELFSLMNTPVEGDGGNVCLAEEDQLTISRDGSILLQVRKGAVLLVRDQQFGVDVRDLFLAFIQISPNPRLSLNGRAITSYKYSQLREYFAYVDPSRDFFNGTLLENITSFQTTRFRRLALFWSFLSGLDQHVRSLPHGYNTDMDTQNSTGLSRDARALAHVVTALSRNPRILLLDVSDCSYGTSFVNGLTQILKRCRGNITVLIAGDGMVLNKLSDEQIVLPTTCQRSFI